MLTVVIRDEAGTLVHYMTREELAGLLAVLDRLDRLRVWLDVTTCPECWTVGGVCRQCGRLAQLANGEPWPERTP